MLSYLRKRMNISKFFILNGKNMGKYFKQNLVILSNLLVNLVKVLKFGVHIWSVD